MMKRTIILMLDSLGIGASADADKFGDVGSNTFGHIAQWCADGKANEGREGPLHIPNLTKLGLAHACADSVGSFPAGLDESAEVIGAYGYAQEISSGKDTPSGHWEIAGVPVLFDWGYFSDKENSFPQELLDQLVEQADLPGYLGNCHSSGTEILDLLGAEHMASGKPIFYTSADSVFQIACHEETFGLERLLKLCELARELLEPYNIGRVIARPFIGSDKENFQRTGNRRDYSVLPPAPTVLDKLTENGGHVISVGKIADIFAHQGISEKTKATGIDALVDATIVHINSAPDKSLIFTNLVNFDQDYGHRRDPIGFAKALQGFDKRLSEIMAAMNNDDVLFLTSDHGCDPTWPGNDHTREYLPVIAYHHLVRSVNLGERKTFADLGQTIADIFGLEKMNYGTSFLKQLSFVG